MIELSLSQRIQDRAACYGFKDAGYDSEVPAVLTQNNIQCLGYETLWKRWEVDMYAGFDTMLKQLQRQLAAPRALWKASLVNLVLYNYQQSLQGDPIIPCLFCIDADNLPSPLSTERLLMDRAPTSREVRRAYKLCYDPKIAEEIQQIARKSFIFIKVHKQLIESGETNLDTCFTILPFPWDTEVGKQWVQNRSRYPKETRTDDPFTKGFWRNAVKAFYLKVTPSTNLTHYLQANNSCLEKEERCFVERVKWLSQFPSELENASQIASTIQTEEAKSSALTHLVAPYLAQNNRDKSVEIMQQMSLFTHQEEAIEQIVAYDLKQSPPDYSNALQLATGPYAGREQGRIGASKSERFIAVSLAQNGRIEEACNVADAILKSDLHNRNNTDNTSCYCDSCEAIREVSQYAIQDEAARTQGEASA